MGSHLDKELRKVQSLVSRMLAQHQGGPCLEMLLLKLSSGGGPRGKCLISLALPTWETQGLRDKLLSKKITGIWRPVKPSWTEASSKYFY